LEARRAISCRANTPWHGRAAIFGAP
jgi:hypothetical protein